MREIKVKIPHIISNRRDSATINIIKSGIKITDKIPNYLTDNRVIESRLQQIIDMDSWKYSWHFDISKARISGSEERKQLRDIIVSKIGQRRREIKALTDARELLRRWH